MILKKLKSIIVCFLFTMSAVYSFADKNSEFEPSVSVDANQTEVQNEENKESPDFIAPRLSEERKKAEEIKNNFIWRKADGNPLPEYEKLIFDAMWKFVVVGEASLELRGFDDIDGRKAHHIYSYAKTKPFFDSVFKVRDRNESWLDEESKSVLKFSSKISEGNYRKQEAIYFNQAEHTFLLDNNGKMQKGTIPENVQDVLSALYYFRTMNVTVGKSYVLDAHTGSKSWPLKIKVIKKDKIKVPAGSFNCLVLEPAIRENEGIFKAKGKMQVWVTDDDIKMPVYLNVKIPILGAVEAKLSKIQNPAIETLAGREISDGE